MPVNPVISGGSNGGGGGQQSSYVSGFWYADLGLTTGNSASALATGRIFFGSITAFGKLQITGIGVRPNIIPRTYRLGLYTSSRGKPATKILTGSVVSSTFTGKTFIVCTHILTSETAWLAMVVQSSPATGSCSRIAYPYGSRQKLEAGNSFAGWRSTASTFTGVLPAAAPTLVPVSAFGTMPWIAAQVA